MPPSLKIKGLLAGLKCQDLPTLLSQRLHVSQTPHSTWLLININGLNIPMIDWRNVCASIVNEY